MSYFRKKPVTIEAVLAETQIRYATNDWRQLEPWIAAAYEKGDILFLPGSVQIKTLEGTLTAQNSDWIIQGVNGELYPCKPDIFFKTYDPV